MPEPGAGGHWGGVMRQGLPDRTPGTGPSGVPPQVSRAELANIFCKELDSQQFRLCGPRRRGGYVRDGCGYVPIKLYLRTQAAGRTWPAGCSPQLLLEQQTAGFLDGAEADSSADRPPPSRLTQSGRRPLRPGPGAASGGPVCSPGPSGVRGPLRPGVRELLRTRGAPTTITLLWRRPRLWW